MPIVFRCCHCGDEKSSEGHLPGGFVYAKEHIRTVRGYTVLCADCDDLLTRRLDVVLDRIRPHLLLMLADEMDCMPTYLRLGNGPHSAVALPGRENGVKVCLESEK